MEAIRLEVVREAFFQELELLYRKYNVSLGHEDGHGAFILTSFDEGNLEWVKDALIEV